MTKTNVDVNTEDHTDDAGVADVCLLMEGTYPYVSGGVSTWTQKLITSFPERTFTLLHLSPKSDSFDSYKYTIPDNVVNVRDEYLFEDRDYSDDMPESVESTTDTQVLNPAEVFRKLYYRDWDILEPLTRQLRSGQITRDEILNSEESYQTVENLYREDDLSVSFLHFFWNTRFLISPLLRILSFELPDAKLYHAVSAGYGGFLGVLARMISDRPFLLTEHGIYMRERIIELDRSNWVRENDESEYFISERQEHFQQKWKSFFRDLTHLIYTYATGIVTISQKNQEYQRKLGASPTRMKLIPNGVSISEFDHDFSRSATAEPDSLFRIALIGRVVPIKDIRTYIQAVKLLTFRGFPIQAYVTGGTDEDPEYYEECLHLQKMLNLESHLEFTGRKDIPAFFEEVDLVVLTSIKEAQPLVIIEANCVGLPVVATRVGSCPELIYGREGADEQIGKSGLVTGIASPNETADAIERLYRDQSLYRLCSEHGRERVRTFYNWENVRNEYNRVYQNFLSGEPWQELGSI